VDSRRWWLLAGAVPVATACALASGNAALRPLGDVAVMVTGLVAAVVLWVAGGRRDRSTSWRLLAVAPLLPVLGYGLAALVDPPDTLQLVVIRWIPTVPAYVLAIIGSLGFAGRARLRTGRRLAVEVALFFTACLIVVNLLVTGSGGGWVALGPQEKVVLGAAVVATSAAMAAALTLLGVVEARRRSMAAALLAGMVLLASGRGLGTSAMLSGTLGAVDVSRFLIAAGLHLLVVAVLLAPRPGDRPAGPPRDRSTDVGQMLPHIALLLAVTAAGGAALTDRGLGLGTFVAAVLCVALAGVHRWITACDEQRMATRLQRSEAYFRSVVQSAGDAVVILDDDLRISWASNVLQRSLGPAAVALVGRPLLGVVHPDDVAALTAALPNTGPVPARVPAATDLLTLRLPDAAGEWRYLEAGVSDLRCDAQVGAVVLHCRDMTDRHAREQALQSVAYTDPMTGLPNRAGFLRLVQAALDDALDLPRTVLIIELDGLPAARENVGRETVSTVVAEIGRRLRATVRGEDSVARMGGGGFGVLTHGDDADADRLAARCLSVVEQPILTPAGIIELTAGVGVVALEDGLGVEALLGRGDLAVRAAHDAGAGSARRYQAALGDAAARRDQLRTDLQGAQAREELFLLFQPVVSLEQQRITGVEAQLHWRHPILGEVPPAEFIPLAERAGLIGELLRWGLEEATSAAVGLPQGAGSLRMGMKVPFGYLATGALVADVEHALRRSGLAPEQLVLQISAPVVMSEDERTGLDVASLRLMGVHVALDGFGSGSSALAHLTRLPIDIVKLDRSLITKIDRDPQSRALCESIVGIGRALGLDVVAEGVETPAQLTALCGFGCGFAQGFLIARPMPLAGFTAMLTDGAGLLWPGLVASR
jgi:diguanylate cyclase (GGDEF)-like protein/PAS domain S-box-containing protein